MNINEFTHYAEDKLKNANIETPVQEAGVMLCQVLNCGRAYLYAHGDRELSSDEKAILDHMLAQRAKNIPLQYIIGDTEFMSLRFMVTPAVLIPRQDTEILVEKVIELAKKRVFERKNEGSSARLNVLDMCTGSGCIAVSIACFCSQCDIIACDISEEAIKVAKANSELNGVQNRVEFFGGDLFKALEALEGNYKFDFIVSNPPYIETEIISGLQKEVSSYEPGLALDGGADGLDFYRRITAKAPEYLNKLGWLAFEIGYNQGERVSALMKESFTNIQVLKDYGGNDRVVIGQLSN
ncbi:peptide chain release factor N(5)-glutamine methyltransferase [Ruminiclostridium papyrosolvens]|uniref:Release factor glutamine methyltransferase n=1 Tax=Ruminiclostridium papyrosolvens C7 TaxID=1330534 RepID=U4QZJ3_9FIRM|nr:peptide chain release factor N(5)-glutamine methyltransferase [Ruminiclostridium papyrosolvens]EPR09553.1 N5-glutamine S-adenosyl-L-methionine-dependent methyltransferase [Ruminiclostridium papyrosolvens C7]